MSGAFHRIRILDLKEACKDQLVYLILEVMKLKPGLLGVIKHF